MEVVLNATLAGGVSIGSASDLVVTPGIGMIIGFAAGILSAIGFLKIGPFLREKAGLYDTCGVHNLHGMPGVFGGLVGSFSAGLASNAFAEGSPELINTFSALEGGKRTITMQGYMQFAALCVTLFISITSGLLSGYIATRFAPVEDVFVDHLTWDECEYDLEDEHTEAGPKTDHTINDQTNI